MTEIFCPFLTRPFGGEWNCHASTLVTGTKDFTPIVLTNSISFAMNKKSTYLKRVSWLSTLLLLIASLSFAQTRTIKGRVIDAKDNTPLPGVTVKLKNSNSGTATGVNGTYSIVVPAQTTALEFSFIGYETKEVRIGSGDEINVGLALSSKTLNDVVVVGYGTLKRREITSAVTSIKAEDFNQGGTRSAMDLVQGKVAGLSITRTRGNNPNEGASLQLRGVTSLSGTNGPLIVIDGIPGGNLDLLTQDDIASIDVLRDGSAAAIYGTRGNGGVILVTTKKGKSGEPQFNYSTYLQREVVDKKPVTLTAEEYKAVTTPTNHLGADVNLYDMLINKDNLSHYHNFSATGGTDKSNYRAAIYYSDAQGIAIRNNRQQYGGRLNLNQTGLQGKLTMQLNLATNFNKADLLGGSTGDFEQAVQRNPTAPIIGPDGKYIETTAFNNYNPIARLQQELSERDQQTLSGDAKVTLEVINGLRVSAFGAIMRNNWNDRQYRNRASRSSQNDYQGGGYAYKRNDNQVNRIFESTIDYSKNFGGDHDVQVVGGYSYQYATQEWFSANNSGFLTDAFADWNLGNGVYLTQGKAGMGSNKEDNTLIAFFGRVNYAFRKKYMAQLSLRHEGSSKFGNNNKWGNFPSVSAGWMLSEEEFMKAIPVVNELKLRAGYGVTGNDGWANYLSQVMLSTGGSYLQNGVWYQTYGPSKNPNPDLRWEKKKEYNIGIDFSLLNRRLSGSIDYYTRETEDLAINAVAQLPPYVTENLFTNVGTITNKGFEIYINAIPVQTKEVTWRTDLTFNNQNNKLKSLSNDKFSINLLEFGGLPSPGALGNAIRIVEGGTIGNFYGKRFAGFTDQGKWLFYKKDGSKAEAAAMTEEDKTVLGNSIPKYMASWSNNVRYKNFDLTIFFRGKFGYKILNLQDLYFANKQWLPNNMLKRGLTVHGQLNDAPQYSDYYLEKGDFVKLDNITLGYNFKLSTKYIRSLRLYATGRNIATITNYSGLDPELQDNGLTTGIDERGFYPRTKSFAVGLQVGF